MTRIPLVVLVLLSACSGGAKEEAEAPVKPVAEVRTAPATAAVSAETVTAYGISEAAPGEERILIAPAEAIIATVIAPTGTSVAAGAPIVTLRPGRTAQLDIAKSATDTRVAQASYARALRLKSDGLVSDAEVEAARAALATATAERGNIGIFRGGITLRAPAAGTVRALTARPGDQVAAGTTLATIAATGAALRARFGVDPAVARRIAIGQTVRVAGSAGGAPASATVTGIDPQLDSTTRLASVFLRLPAGMALGVGEPLTATFATGAAANGITIPYAALLDDGGKSYVFVVKGGAAHRVAVTPGNSSGDAVQILAGLGVGDRVVVEGGTALDDGMAVHEAAAPR